MKGEIERKDKAFERKRADKRRRYWEKENLRKGKKRGEKRRKESEDKREGKTANERGRKKELEKKTKKQRNTRRQEDRHINTDKHDRQRDKQI